VVENTNFINPEKNFALWLRHEIENAKFPNQDPESEAENLELRGKEPQIRALHCS